MICVNSLLVLRRASDKKGKCVTIILEAYGYRVECAPDHGATLLGAWWTRNGGDPVPVLEPLDIQKDGFQAGCFLMAPFANRIANGRFAFDGRDHLIPLNRPAQGMAIHGFSRDRAWHVLEIAPDHLRLRDVVVCADHPWRYTLTLDLNLFARGLAISLTVRNDGRNSLPFGMGLHPFFPRDPETTLTFLASGSFTADSRGLPALPFNPTERLGNGQRERVQHWRGTDLCFVDWKKQRACIEWPERQCALSISADGAFRHLHIYVPAERNVICVEPVSHLPDAINRPDLGSDAAMTTLMPGESLQGSVLLSAYEL